jgi:hypothetical protein
MASLLTAAEGLEANYVMGQGAIGISLKSQLPC